MRRKRSFLNGFTLIELLVTIFIISLLLSIFLVSIIQIKDHVRKIMCANNLKQIGTFFTIMYNEDKKSGPKNDNDYLNFATNYVKSDKLFLCPMDKKNHINKITNYNINNNNSVFASYHGVGRDWNIQNDYLVFWDWDINHLEDDTIYFDEKNGKIIDTIIWGNHYGKGANTTNMRAEVYWKKLK